MLNLWWRNITCYLGSDSVSCGRPPCTRRNFAFVLKEWRLKTGKAAQRCFSISNTKNALQDHQIEHHRCCGHHLWPDIWAQSQGQSFHSRLVAGQGLSRARLNNRRSLLGFGLFSWEEKKELARQRKNLNRAQSLQESELEDLFLSAVVCLCYLVIP
jgi:hypothetical protein